MQRLLSVFVLAAVAGAAPLYANEPVKVDASAKGDAFPHFWAGTGMAYVDFTTKTQYENVIMIAGIPHEDTLIRCHDTLRSLDIIAYDGQKMTLGFRRHDVWMDHNVKFCGLPQIYEFMGSPRLVDKRSSFYTDKERAEIAKNVTAVFSSKASPEPLYNAYVQLVRHCIERYGIEEVRRWWWQDLNEDFDAKQFDAVEAAVKETDPTLIFGGDHRMRSGADTLSHWGKNISSVTGKPLRMDYYSHHVKDTPDVIVKGIKGVIDYKEKNFPDKPDIIWANWECDREWGQAKVLPHRATAYYSAWKAATVDAHARAFLQGDKKRQIRLNFDDAFISDVWERRNLFTVVDEQLVKRPISNVLVMFTLLGDRLLPIEGLGKDKNVGVLATARGQDEVAVLLYHYDSSDTKVGGDPRTVDLNIASLPFDKGRMVHYRLDGDHGDIWAKARAGMHGTELVKHDELPRYQDKAPSEITGGRFIASVELPRQSVSLILLARDPGKEPPAVPKLRAKSYPHSSGGKQVYLLWNDASRALRTYEVEAAQAESGPWQRVNDESLWTAYSEPLVKDAKRFYRVRAVDLWDRPGPWTNPIEAPEPTDQGVVLPPPPKQPK